MPNELIFSESPTVGYATNTFKNVPIILQYDETPLIEVVQEQDAGFTSQFNIYNKDGVYIAKAKGSQLYLTEEGKKVNLNMRHPHGATVCELDGQTLFEIRRTEAAALRTQAELFTPDGRFVRSNPHGVPCDLVLADGAPLSIGTITLVGNHFEGMRIGVLIRSDGTIAIGVS